MPFAQNLDYLMKTKGLSKYRLSKDLSCHQSTVANWLSGETEPHTNMQMQIAAYFGVSTERLMGDEFFESEKMPQPTAEATNLVKQQLYGIIEKMSKGQLMLLLEKAQDIENL